MNDKIMKIILAGIVVFVAEFGLVFFPMDIARADDDAVVNTIDQVGTSAEKARMEAAKALAEAQKAMAEADDAIRKAKTKRQEAQKIQNDAFHKMVSDGYYPSDITLTTSDGKINAVFSHKKHLLREHLKCTQCHPKYFTMKVGDNVVKRSTFTMENMRKGRYCGGCHNGKKAFSVADLKSCKRCHPQQL